MSKIKWLNCRQVLQGAPVSLEFSSGKLLSVLSFDPQICREIYSIPYFMYFKAWTVLILPWPQGFPVCPSQTSQCSGTVILKGSWRNCAVKRMTLQESESSSNTSCVDKFNSFKVWWGKKAPQSALAACLLWFLQCVNTVRRVTGWGDFSAKQHKSEISSMLVKIFPCLQL